MVVKNHQLSPQDQSDEILQCVKTSNPHYAVNETSFSVYITLRKKFINRDIKMVTAAESDALKVKLSQNYQKCEDLIQKNTELIHLIEKKDDKTSTLESLLHDKEKILEKAKVELSEALGKVNDVLKENKENLKRFDTFTERQKIVQDNLK
jgi:hypothetical protein